jgi:DNA modification methylase
MKPVALIERMIANSSRPGQVVLDPFVGSGTSLIAAERLRRRCFAMELDPAYAQVSIERWRRFSGKTPQRLDVRP